MTALRLQMILTNDLADAGRNSGAQNGRRGHGVMSMGKSMRAQGTELVPQTESVPKMTENAAAAGISAVILPFTAGQLARVAGRSKDTAKSWLEGARCPHLASVINLARALPSVWVWLAEECGHASDARSSSADAVIRWAMHNRNVDGQDGAMARAILREAAAPPDEKRPPAASADVARPRAARRSWP